MIELWRTDIYENHFLVTTFQDEEEEIAEQVRTHYEFKGHNQTYWLKKVDEEGSE